MKVSAKQTVALSVLSGSTMLLAFQNCGGDFSSTARESSLNYIASHPVLSPRNNFTFIDDGPVVSTSGTSGTSGASGSSGTSKNNSSGTNNPSTGGGGTNVRGGTGSGTGTGTSGTNGTTNPNSTTTTTTTALNNKPVAPALICSNRFSINSGTNVQQAIRMNKDVYLAYFDANDQAHCAQKIDLNSVLTTKTVNLPACPELSGQTVGINISVDKAIAPPKGIPMNPTGQPPTNTLLAPVNFGSSLNQQSLFAASYDQVQFDSTGVASLVSHAETDWQKKEHLSAAAAANLQLLYALNKAAGAKPANFEASDYGVQADCEGTASPLIIQLPPKNQEAEIVRLTSIDQGVLFDILGANDHPVAHQAEQISWLTPASRADNYFLALPNISGEVNGIDELFGNNTQGPDGQFAANGYEALRKYDLNGDGVIDRQDVIFWRLKLWSDRNGDGIAQPNELHSLNELNVRSISLNYDPNFKETDQYGNVVKYKSIVTTSDGQMHLAFDIWFKLQTPLL